MRMLLAAIGICAAAPAALAQSYSASGHAGYLQEWEIKASLVKTASGAVEDFDGPVTLRHVGLCSVNGIEEKSGTLRLSVSRSGAEGTLTMPDDSCRIRAASSRPYSGLLDCRKGEGVPIHFSIDQADSVNKDAVAAAK